MNRTSISLSIASLAALAVFCATATYWVVTLASPKPLPSQAASVQPPESVDAAAHLFGDDPSQNNRIRLSGILSLSGRGAAAIVSVDGAPSQAIAVGQAIDSQVKLAEVHEHSIIISEGGVRSEVSMTDATTQGAGVTAFMH